MVTGGGSGLGEAVVRAIVEAGGRVAIVDLPTSKGEAVAAELGEATAFASADVTSAEDVSAALDLAAERLGEVRIAVSCAGIAWAGRIVDRRGPHDLDVFSSVVGVNLIGTFNVARLAAERMGALEPIGEERGVIVNTSSIAAFDGQVGQVAYAASKGGVAALTLPVARDLASRKIRCVAIAPGVFDTPMMAQLPQPAREQLAHLVPHPARLGHPAEFAAMVRHVIENPMLNGEVIRLDGALRMPFVR